MAGRGVNIQPLPHSIARGQGACSGNGIGARASSGVWRWVSRDDDMLADSRLVGVHAGQAWGKENPEGSDGTRRVGQPCGANGAPGLSSSPAWRKQAASGVVAAAWRAPKRHSSSEPLLSPRYAAAPSRFCIANAPRLRTGPMQTPCEPPAGAGTQAGGHTKYVQTLREPGRRAPAAHPPASACARRPACAPQSAAAAPSRPGNTAAERECRSRTRSSQNW
jgi:hypothetical protein